MPLYEYRCSKCKATYLTVIRDDSTPCHFCNGFGIRRFGFNFKRPMQEHFNHSTGQFVTNERAFRTQLKRQSEIQTIRTGIEHTYQPVDDPMTKASLGVTTAGLEDQAKWRHDHNIPMEDAIK